MKQEFITTNGKVIIDDGVIHVKKLVHHSSGEFNFLIFWTMYILFLLIDETKIRPLLYIVLGLLALAFLIMIFERVFIKSWKKKIPLANIKSYRVNKDVAGLETKVVLFLRSGRQKEIVFRNHDHQLDPFLDIVTQQITQTQFAH